MQLKAPLIVAAAALYAHVACGQDGPRVQVEDVRMLLIAAIDSPNGEARGVLTGQMARMITERFRATGPILIDVTTHKRYAQPGCSRLNLLFSQSGVQLPGASAPQLKTVDIGINYCRDGLPPKSLS
jgi:hypothetical protein